MRRNAAICLTICLIVLSNAIGRATETPQPVASPKAVVSPKATASPQPLATQTPFVRAPADEYFGAFGMSPLSIRSTIGLLGRQYHWRTISDHDLLRKALLTESALRAWRTKYPRDPWLAPTFYHLEQLYQAVQSEEAHKHATSMLKFVIVTFPGSKEAHSSKLRLAAGFPPLQPESPLVESPPPATPSPTESPSPSESPTPGGSPSPGPSAGSTAATAPQAGASPTPSPRL